MPPIRRSTLVSGGAVVFAVAVVTAAMLTMPRGSAGSEPAAAVAPDPARSRRATTSTVAVDPAHEQLPDLDQAEPAEVAVEAQKTADGRVTYRLGFRSAVANVGDGPLIVEGSRPGPSTPTMMVDQLIEQRTGALRIVHGVGRMQYSVSPDHSHWHYLQFDRYELQYYELRPAGSTQPIARDRKTGFCLGDRYRVKAPTHSVAPVAPVFRGSCGRNKPGLLHMREGISVGYGDDYSAFLEGQDLPLDGLADGRYVLVHRVNVDRQLVELSYANNASSLLLELRWVNGTPTVAVVAACPDSDRCDE